MVLVLKEPRGAVNQRSFAVLCLDPIITSKGTVARYFDFQEALEIQMFISYLPRLK